jgi:AraC-like DNA-binding protein
MLSEPCFRVGNVETVNLTRDKGYRHSYKNGRDKCGFVYIVRGSLLEIFSREDVKEIRINAGEVCFIPSGERYVGVYDENDTEAKIIQFDLIEGSLPEFLRVPGKIEFPDVTKLIDSFFLSEGNGGTPHPFYYLSRMYELLWRIDGFYSGIRVKHIKLRAALDELASDFAQNKPIGYYAGLCGMSEVSFRRAFREYTGSSPIDYRNALRLEYAGRLLRSGEYNVSEAAALSGFSNVSFFIRSYKKKHGKTPKKFQNNS